MTRPHQAHRRRDRRRDRLRRDVSAVEVTEAHLDRIAAVDDRVHAFLHVDAEGALAPRPGGRRAGAPRASELGPLAGVPLALKDVFTTEGVPDHLRLEDPRGLAAAVRRDRHAPAARGRRRHPRQDQHGRVRDGLAPPRTRPSARPTTRGTSTASPAAPAAARPRRSPRTRRRWRSAPTPAARSASPPRSPARSASSRRTAASRRYGLVALASSLDQAGPCARTVLDAALLHEAIAGHDPLDSTSIDAPGPRRRRRPPARRRARACGSAWSSSSAARATSPASSSASTRRSSCSRSSAPTVVEVDCPHFDYALPAYYLIAPSECSSQPGPVRRHALRPAGRRRRHRAAPRRSWRSPATPGFGAEVKRRIMLGTYALSSGYYDAYYGQAQKVRTLIARDFDAAFEQVDVLVSPTTPTTAFPHRRAGRRPDGDVPRRPVHHPVQPGRQRRDVAAVRARARGRSAGRPADHGAADWPTTGSTGSAPRSRPRSPTGGGTC